MDGHTEYKPKDCKFCYFWSRQHGCTFNGKTACYYDTDKRNEGKKSDCDGCPYGRTFPCIGWCTKEVMRSVGLLRESERK